MKNSKHKYVECTLYYYKIYKQYYYLLLYNNNNHNKKINVNKVYYNKNNMYPK